MKFLVGSDIGAYTFDAVTKTITLTGMSSSSSREKLLLITNCISNKVLYTFNDPASALVSHTYVSGTITIVLNASIDTSAMLNTDKLQIWYEATKSQNPYNSMPRGHMFNLVSRHCPNNPLQYPLSVDSFHEIDFVHSYPTSDTSVGYKNNNDLPSGFNMMFVGPSPVGIVPNLDGIIMLPPVGVSIFVERITLIVEVANAVDISKPLCSDGCYVEISHSGQVFCKAKTIADLLCIAENPTTMESVFTSHFITYFIPIVCKPAGQFSGTKQEYLQIRNSDGKAALSAYCSHFYISTTMWEVRV